MLNKSQAAGVKDETMNKIEWRERKSVTEADWNIKPISAASVAKSSMAREKTYCTKERGPRIKPAAATTSVMAAVRNESATLKSIRYL